MSVNEQQIVLDAKKEYIKHLQIVLCKPVYKIILQIYESCKLKNGKKCFKSFQTEMADINNWSIIKLEEHIVKIGDTELIEKIIEALVIINARILGCIRKKSQERIKIILPSVKTFIHKVFLEVGSVFYMEPYLIDYEGSKDGQRNIQICIKLVNECIEESLRKILPFRSIIDDYFPKEEKIINIDNGNSDNDEEKLDHEEHFEEEDDEENIEHPEESEISDEQNENEDGVKIIDMNNGRQQENENSNNPNSPNSSIFF